MSNKDALVFALRALGFDTQAAELETSTTYATERAALEAAANFVAGYERALWRYETALRETAAPTEAIACEELELALVARQAEISAQAHLEGRTL